VRFVVAVDPGANGGVAVFAGAVRCLNLPRKDDDKLSLFTALAAEAGAVSEAPPVLVLERVGGYIEGRPAPGSHMFNFGWGAAFVAGVCRGRGYSFFHVRPQDWQAPLGLGTSEQAGGERPWKRLLLAEARRRFPHLKVTGRTGDALLIGDYFWTTHLGQRPLSFPPQASPGLCGARDWPTALTVQSSTTTNKE
jgi:hypothetical protein